MAGGELTRDVYRDEDNGGGEGMSITAEQGTAWAERLRIEDGGRPGGLDGVLSAREIIRVDLIDRAGTRYCFGRVSESLYDLCGESIDRAARIAAGLMHGAVQTYYEDDPERTVEL